MPVFSPLRLIRRSRPWAKVCWGCRWVSVDSAPTAAARNAHYCYTRVTKADTSGVEADLDVLDEHGAVLLAVQGLRLGTGVSENGHEDRVLAERLLTIEWRQRELPEVEYADAGTWLLISTTATADVVATTLTDALKNHGAQCTTMCWPPHADHTSNAEQLGNHLRAGGFTGVVILTGPKNGDAEDQSPLLGREYVQHLVRITRELPEIPGEPPRLYVVTRNAQTVLAGDRPNLEQAGLRGLMRVIGTEHPHLRATQIDVDEATDAEQLARQLLGGSEEDETAWRNGQWYTARLCPTPLRPEERQTTVVDHERDGMRLQIRTPGDLESMELVACDRVPPGPGQIEVAVTASSINFADVLVAFGRYPSLRGAAAAAGHRFRRRGDRGRTRRDRSPGRRPCRRPVRQRLLGHVRHLRRQPGRHAAGRPGRRPGGRGDHRDTPPPGTACTTWPASRPATRC